MSMIDGQRLQKYLADRGVASRRESARIIESGRVTVNGNPVTAPGFRVSPDTDVIQLDGRDITKPVEKRRTIVLHKPRGYVCSTSGQSSPTVYELIPNIKERLVPVGRLDKNSEGLLLMSNDGDLVNRLTHPRFEQEKVYRVVVSGTVNAGTIAQLSSRIVIDGYRIRSAKVVKENESRTDNKTVIQVTLKEGRKRQIRAMCEQAGLKIHRLIRTRVKSLSLKGLRSGEWRELTKGELNALQSESG